VRLLRSWPAQAPPGRACVDDGIQRLVISGYRYDALAGIDDSVVLIEWDVACDPVDLRAFAQAAAAAPERVLVAPYRLHVTTVRGAPLPAPVWVHRYDDGRHVETGAPFCHWFGLGLAYLPRPLVLAYLADAQAGGWSEGLNDCSFSMWHWRVVATQVPIAWEVRPVHLHYQTPTL
jgi:hypothetical protein